MIDATPLLRVYAARRLARLAVQDGAAAQQATLLHLVRTATATKFGQGHGFAAIRSVADFQRRVPLRDYEAFWPAVLASGFPNLTDAAWPGLIPYFALSSGTSTGRTKYIPVSRAMLRSNRRAALDVLVHHIANRPRSRVMAGRSFMLGGSTALTQEAPGVFSGDLSGIAAADIPFWARPWSFPPRDLALIADWDRKIAAFAARSPAANIRSISGTPSWLLLYFQRLAQTRPDLPRNLGAHYPDLALLVHGGVSMAPYRAQFDRWLEGGHAELREVYPASEGFFAVADRGGGEGMRLLLDNGLFFEFIPAGEIGDAAPPRHWIADAEIGVDYALAVSTCAGLWSFVVGDVVRLVSRDPPRVVVSGRTSYYMSAYGEHLSGAEIERAVLAAAAAAGLQVAEFSVGAAPAGDDGMRGGHVWVIEFTAEEPHDATLQLFTGTLDDALSEGNDDYRAHREGGQLMAPRVCAAPPGTFASWMKQRGRLGGQNKVPRVINDAQLLDTLLHVANGGSMRGRSSAET